MTANLGWQLTQFFVGWMVASVLVGAGFCWLVHRYPPPDDRVARHRARPRDQIASRDGGHAMTAIVRDGDNASEQPLPGGPSEGEPDMRNTANAPKGGRVPPGAAPPDPRGRDEPPPPPGARCVQTVTVLYRSHATNFRPKEEHGAREHELYLDKSVWRDLGRPDVLTVTIELGDLLNGGVDV